MPRHRRSALIILALAIMASMVANRLFPERADGVSVDLLHAVSKQLPASPALTQPDDRTVIVAIDEQTYQRPPFAHTPQVAWTPQVATVLDALLDGGARVIGIDTIFNQSLHYVGDLVPEMPDASQVFANYDRDLLSALAKGGRQGRIVMSYTRQGGKTIDPTRAQIAAVGGAANLRPTNMDTEESDGVIRHALLTQLATSNDAGVQPITSLPLELFARAGGHKISFIDGHRPLIDGVPLADTLPDNLLINFKPVTRDPLLYSFADLFACAQTGHTDYFQNAFNGRTVILGAVLDLEDRHLTSKRYATNPMGRNYATPCVWPTMQELSNNHASNFIPGTYILATIVDNLREQNWLRPTNTSLRLISLLALALMTCVLIVHARASIAIFGLAVLAMAWLALATSAFQQNLVLPLITGYVAIVLSLMLGLAYRVMLVDRGRRQLRRYFSLYLPTAEVDRLVTQDRMPALGGELRPVTMLFSDIAGYSSLSEDLAPGDLVTDLNRYFGRMTEIVQQHGGFVDKFVGDGILAVFGAPLADSNHAFSGVSAALDMIAACQDDPLMTINGQRFGIRIGVHSGDAVVGNIGSPSRFNYTVVGDSVNLASRLEGVGKRYHATIIVSEQTRQLIGDRLAFRELDLVRVVGRDQPVRLFLPMPPDVALTYNDDRWMTALSAWRQGDFKQAAEICDSLAQDGDGIAATFGERAHKLAISPPAGWDGIVNLSEK
ncbi:MAG TPA: adenylate/guanylate cyclase domain-containing protein [Dongiaceae bacterium]